MEEERNTIQKDSEFLGAPSIALTTMIDEYTKERERGGILDNKATALITILLALVTVYMPIIPFSKINKIYASGGKNQLIALGVLVLIFIVVLIIIIIAFIKLIDVVKLKTYHRIDIKQMTQDDNFRLAKEEYEVALCNHYKEIIFQNSEINDNKSRKIGSCFILTIISFLILLVVCIGMMLL